MQPVTDGDGVAVLALDDERVFGDQAFERSLMGLVAGKKGLVGEQHAAIVQMGIEPADQVRRVRDVHAVMPEEPHDIAAERLLPVPFSVLRSDERHLARLFGVLDQPGQPVQHILGMSRSPRQITLKM